MMEIESKGSQSNPIFVTQSISKLIEKIKNKQGNEAPLKYLKETCITSEDTLVSLAASKGLVMLVECGILQLSTTLSELVSALSVTKSYAGIILAICDLLQIDLKYKTNRNEKYKCPFNLRAPQHPLITVLNQQPTTWVDVLNNIKYIYEIDNKQVKFHTNELFYSFYMYVMCNPTSKVPEVFQYKLWNFLIATNNNQSVDITLYILMWLQISTKYHCLKTSNYLIDAILHKNVGEDGDIKQILLLWLTSLLFELIKHQNDPRGVITCLYDVIKSKEDLNDSAGSILIMLANCIPLCSSVYLYDLLKLCKFIIEFNLTNELSSQLIKVSLLHWLAYGCILTADSLQLINYLLLYVENNTESKPCNTKRLRTNKKLGLLKSTNQHVYSAIQLSILSESLMPVNILDWLNRTTKLSVFSQKNLYNYYAVLLLTEFKNSEITLRVIEILLKIADVYRETTAQVLTLILYKLSNSSNPKVHFSLLKALPKMAVLKENLPLVLNTLKVVGKEASNMKSFAITLFFDLWNIDVKCYPHLQNALVTPCDKTDGLTHWWEFQVTKAHVLKEICLKRPELHGRELVGHLSEILNKCTDNDGALASAIAIEGIKALCNAGIIDISSTWKELAPRFSTETRVNVIKSLCELITEASYFEPSECSDKLIEEVIDKLWFYATMHEDASVIYAAYNALACFKLEQVSAKLLDIIETSTPGSTPAFLPFGLIKGDYWITLLLQSQCTALEAIGNLLIKFISTEISNYHSRTYQVEEGRREPQDYNYLPEHSIVRALGNYVKRQVQKWQDSTIKPTYLQCLRALSQQYVKPLPPTDWCFLQELIHFTETRCYCITLASHQVQLSGTARRLIENYVTILTQTNDNDENILTIYENLKYLCNSIQPMTLRPFVETSVAYALQKAQNAENTEEETLFKTLIVHLKEALSDANLQDANKMVLSQVIVHTTLQINTEHPLFTILLDSIIALPIRYIDELSSPRLWKDETNTKLKLSVRVRCALALQATASPLTWMNDFIDAACFMPSQQHYVLKSLSQVMECYRNSDFSSAWILELLGHIQSTIANENTTNYQVQFLCDVFILSMVILSGQDVFVLSLDDLIKTPEYRLELFPQAVAQLATTQRWKYVSQIAEWLFHMTNYSNTPDDYKVTFYQSLAALRHKDAFEKSSKWLKYLGCAIPTDS